MTVTNVKLSVIVVLSELHTRIHTTSLALITFQSDGNIKQLRKFKVVYFGIVVADPVQTLYGLLNT